jgi:hypothetical protein
VDVDVGVGVLVPGASGTAWLAPIGLAWPMPSDSALEKTSAQMTAMNWMCDRRRRTA